MYEAIAVKGKPNAEKRSCYDCYHCKGVVSWWCKNEEIVEMRKTTIPRVINCPGWKPIRTVKQLGFFDRLFFSLFYIKVDCTEKD